MGADLDEGVDRLKALAEPTRLRVVALLQNGDLSVKDLTQVLGQSQPRLSRHLKLLSDAGWIRRFPEGAWVYYRLSDNPVLQRLIQEALVLTGRHDEAFGQDADRLRRLKEAQKSRADAFFQDNAQRWDALRANLIPERAVEEAIVSLLGDHPVERLLDIGTGTGRMLVLLRDLYRQGIGIDPSPAMLQVARVNLADAALDHAQVRHGDGLSLSFGKDSQDLVTLHQVMHFFDDPRPVLAEAARVLSPGGRLLIVDFARHQIEALRTDHQHRRLGFASEEVAHWLRDLDLVPSEPLTLDPGRGTRGQVLPVTLWLAQDRRFVADPLHHTPDLALA